MRFLEGFPPAVDPTTGDGRPELAFTVEGDWTPVAASVGTAQDRAGVTVRWAGGADEPRLRAQLARMLSLDVDGSGFPAVGERDPVVARLQGALRRVATGRVLVAV